MLNFFLKINMPYGMSITKNDEWYFFNREYLPLGETDKNKFEHNWYDNTDYVKYNKSITSKFLEKIINIDGNKLKKDENLKTHGEHLTTIWFYSDDNDPLTNDKMWERYMKNIKLISKLKADNNNVSRYRVVNKYKL